MGHRAPARAWNVIPNAGAFTGAPGEFRLWSYKGHLSDFPLTLAYGQKIDALRRKYKAYLWDGEYRDTLGADVSAEGAFRYSVLVSSEGKRAVVIVNEETQKAIDVRVTVPNAIKLVLATPEQPDAVIITGRCEIPARSAAVVLES